MMEINNITADEEQFDLVEDLLKNVEFERNVWAEKKLCALCPDNNIMNLETLLSSEDTAKLFSVMQDIILIMHEGYEFKQNIIAKRQGREYQGYPLSKELLDCLNEDEMMRLLNKALASFKADGEVTVDAEPKKNVNQVTKSI